MDTADLNPIYVILFYGLRCLVPLGIMLGISYLLKRFGFIKSPPPPPKDWDDSESENDSKGNGGLVHG